MTFLNWAMLIGLAAVSIPILIHLLTRTRARVVDWGAMRFLLASLAARNRRIRIEEIILMALRCLVVAMLVLAMARPFLPTRSTISWALVLPAVLAAAMCAGIGAVMWSARRARWWLLGSAVVLLAIAMGASAAEQVLQKRLWTSAGEKDVAVVIDGSTSMRLPVEGKTNFRRAIDEAKAVIEACKPADAVSLLVAGNVPQPIIGSPTSDRQRLTTALDRLTPTGGSMQVIDALNAAAASLAEGDSPAKKILLITDGQNVGWDLLNDARWEFLAAGLKALPTPPKILVRTLAVPPTFQNVAVAQVAPSRKVIGTDRDVRIDVKVTNTGTGPVEPTEVEMNVEGVSLREQTGQIAPNASETVTFRHRFREPGRHVVTVRAACEDDLPADNIAVRVIEAVEKLPVLIVEGAPSLRPLEGSGAFIELALAPRDEDDDGPGDAGDPDPGAGRGSLGYLVEPEVLPAPEIGTVKNFRKYAVVVLANVPKLPATVADLLVDYVRRGGGLLIAPGRRVQLGDEDANVRTFYNDWKLPGGGAVAPAVLVRRCVAAEKPAHFAMKTFSHPALALTADPTQSDADKVMVEFYWRLGADETDPDVRVGGLLDTGEPFLVERKLGKGYVLMTAMSLDYRAGNLTALNCFVPLVHELAYYLAAPMTVEANVSPGTEVTVELPPRRGKSAAGPLPEGREIAIDVQTPSQQRRRATLRPVGRSARVRFDGTAEPGLYRLLVPPEAHRRYQVPGAAEPAATEAAAVPFAVLADPDESRLETLTDADFSGVKRHVAIMRTETIDELTASVQGDIPGEELWKYLAIGVLLGLLCEVGLTRWIAVQRRSHSTREVQFGTEAIDVKTFRARAREMLAVPEQEP